MDKLETLVLRAKEDVYTYLQGSNFSKILGQGYDFSELRTYESSDDIRHISWINSAKANELYVKKMHEERELLVNVAMLVDGRAIIGKKHELFSHILATLAYSAIYSNNLLQTSFFMGSEFKSFEAFKNVERLEMILNEFFSIDPLGLALEYDKIQKKLLNIEAPKSLFFLVGDFLDEIDLSILAQKHELCVIMLRDKWEENPSVGSDMALVNPLTNSSINKTLSKKALRYYKERLEEHDEKLYAHFDEHSIKHVKIYEKKEAFQKLEQLFYS
ncbi:MAG: Unknown protein [uncultured Sulfurovum sp.]|uniref:DUF58 domain-containing protein n=1 Tax=uncultured Sulfurovum sp. TaxID=269237 RepID=A0A6S6SIK1_9BACT|nr:MAG: Unknown protein [uncultured Sulfurovum sp.]